MRRQTQTVHPFRSFIYSFPTQQDCVLPVDARRKFGEHERSVRVARGAAESNSGFLSALQTSRVHP